MVDGQRRTSRRSLLRFSCLAALAIGKPLAALALGRQKADPFIESLLRKMTLEEKAGQLSLNAGRGIARNLNPGTPVPAPAQMLKAIAQGVVTGYYNIFNADVSRTMQTVALEQSRLGIPLIFAADGRSTFFQLARP